jgi:hypothetical protein
MPKGYTQAEAKALVNQSFETRFPFSSIPMRTRGRVIAAIDNGDHWNVMIEWRLPGRPQQRQWFTKFEIENYMALTEP